jgi:hypothetical protein
LEEIKTEADAKSLESTFRIAKQRRLWLNMPAKYRLPAIYAQREFADAGGLMSYGADTTDLYRRAAVYVDKVLKRAKPADLPVQQATKFEFVINLNAAKQIGLTIPVRVLERANQVIKYVGKGWLRGRDLNPGPQGYEPCELPDCSTPRQ